MTEKDQINVFGRKFEKLGQDRRVQILHAYDLIDVDLEKAFELIRITRNKYLHLWSQDHDDLPTDAIASYESAVLIVVSAIGQDIHDGKIILKPSLVNYLDQKGAFKKKMMKPCNNRVNTDAELRCLILAKVSSRAGDTSR